MTRIRFVVLRRLVQPLACAGLIAAGSRTAAGQTWTHVDAPVEASFVRDLAVAPTSPPTIYSGAVNNLGIVSRLWGGIFRSTGGQPFETLVRYSSVLSLSIDPRSARTVYAASGAIRRTTDGGATWIRVFDGASTAYAVLAAPDGALYAGTYTGTFRSFDGGQFWERVDARFVAARFAADPREPSVVFAAAPHDLQPRDSSFAGGLF